ncbi:MAG: hypothetical protein FWC53_01925 [Firmicutes bacterium]|nr:hypothetical protein [Bacillota bacterium]
MKEVEQLGIQDEITYNGKNLFQYCIENKLNYSCIYWSIRRYGKTPEEAIESYIKNGQGIPTAWIYEKYGVLLNDLRASQNIDSDSVIEIMRSKFVSLEEAVKQLIIRREAKGKNIDEDLLAELYDVLTEDVILDSDEYKEYKKTFHVDKEEEDVILASYARIEDIKRKLLLFDIADAFSRGAFIGDGSNIPRQEVLRIYGVTPEEARMPLDVHEDNRGVLPPDNR